MRKIFLIITILFTIVAMSLYAQSSGASKPYKPLSDFGTDTIAFLHYNFNERADQYKGKTIAEILKDAQIPPKSFVPSSSMYEGKVDGIGIYFDHYTSYERLERYTTDGYLYIYIYFMMNSKPLYDFMRSYDEDHWVIQHYNFFRNVKADRVYTR